MQPGRQPGGPLPKLEDAAGRPAVQQRRYPLRGSERGGCGGQEGDGGAGAPSQGTSVPTLIPLLGPPKVRNANFVPSQESAAYCKELAPERL